ncbi:MAG: HAD family hydrolase, partial [Coriobacteriia bacterium]|nr:HAD family hydrolase [Coriobacteriia bacterium]
MRAILFDLDGTLLDLDLSAFLERYFTALESAAAPLARHANGSDSVMSALHAATRSMMEHRSGATNREVFFAAFAKHSGIDLGEHWSVFEDFYRNVFPTLADTARPAPGARTAVTTARDLGLRVAIATNPIFPLRAVEHRLAWAGLDGSLADVVTSYESMHACKPHPDYFRETAAQLGLDPRDCLMVGDDPVLDL